VNALLANIGLLVLILVPAAILPMIGPWANSPTAGLSIFAWWAILAGGWYWWHTHHRP